MPGQAVQPLARPYIMASTLIAAMAIVGFWPTYLQPLLAGVSETKQVIHFHATVYFGWLALAVTGRSPPATRGYTPRSPGC